MKNSFLVIVLSVSLTPLFGQGIYLSANNFDSNIISFQPVKGERYKISLHELFYKPVVKIITGNSVYTFNKDSVFGYRDKENTVHRFYKKYIYSLLNPGETILLYSRTSLGGYRGSQTIVTYYFSAGAKGPVQPLTKWNLKNAFPTDTAFHELLDMYFHNDDELTGYDRFYKMYKINRVLPASRQKFCCPIKNKPMPGSQ